MKTILKIIIGIGIALILFTIVINIPFTEKINNRLDNNILVAYSKGIGIGGVVSAIFLNNGTIKISHNDLETKSLSSEELNQIKNAINNNQFTISKISILDKWKRKYPGCIDCYTGIGILVNKNGETIKIEPNGVIWNIISKKKLF